MCIRIRILNLIESHFKSDAEFERTANLGAKTVDKWRRDENASYLKIIPQLCKLFKVTSDYLYFGTTNVDGIALDDFQVAVLEETADIKGEREREKFLQNARHFKDLISGDKKGE